MEKVKLLKKLRELGNAVYMFSDDVAINQAEMAVLMKTYGISWDELKYPYNLISKICERKRTDNDLREEFASMLKTLELSRNKGLKHNEHDMKLMIRGFLKGVNFLDKDLGESLIRVS